MSNYTLKGISPEDFSTASANGQEYINHELRTANEMKIIADEFNGAYVTKAMIPKLQARFPEASNLYLDQSKYSSVITLTIVYGNHYDYNHRDEIYICRKDNRRIDGESLRKSAEQKEEEAHKEQTVLDRLEDTVKYYNTIADAYAEIENDLRMFFHNLPSADYNMEDKYKGTITPEKFFETVA